MPSESNTERKDEKMLTNIAWNTFGSIFYCFCQWLMTVVVVHISSYIEAGYLSIAMTTSSSFSAIALFSMRNYQVSDVNGEYSVHEYVGSRVSTCIIAFITCALFSFWGNTGYMFACICSFMAIRVAEALVDVLHGQDQKFEKYNYIGISYIIRGACTIITFILLLLVTENIMWTLMVVAIINLFVALVWDYRMTDRLEKIKPVLISNRVAQLLNCCVPLVIFSFLLSVENLIPKTALERISGTENLGIYSTIATPTLVIQVFAMVAFNPFLPSFSYNYQSGNIEKFRKGILKLLLAFLVSFFIIYIAAYSLGRFALSLVFGEQILDYYKLFMPIIIVTLLTGYIWVLSAIIIGMRQTFFLLIVMTISFLINIAITVPCIKEFGMNGASIAQIVPHTFLIAVMVIKIIVETRKKRV